MNWQLVTQPQRIGVRVSGTPAPQPTSSATAAKALPASLILLMQALFG